MTIRVQTSARLEASLQFPTFVCDIYDRRHCKEAHKISSNDRKHGDSIVYDTSFHAIFTWSVPQVSIIKCMWKWSTGDVKEEWGIKNQEGFIRWDSGAIGKVQEWVCGRLTNTLWGKSFVILCLYKIPKVYSCIKSLNGVALSLIANVSLRHHRVPKKNPEQGISYHFVELFATSVP